MDHVAAADLLFVTNLGVLASLTQSDRVTCAAGQFYVVPSGWTQAVTRAWRGDTRHADVAAIACLLSEGHVRVRQAVAAYGTARAAAATKPAVTTTCMESIMMIDDSTQALSAARQLCTQLNSAVDGLSALRATYQADMDIAARLDEHAAATRALTAKVVDDMAAAAASGKNPWFTDVPRAWHKTTTTRSLPNK